MPDPTGAVLRLGYSPAPNTLPLLHPLEAGWVAPESPWKLEMVPAPHARSLRALLEGELDAAFIPPAAAQKHGAGLAPVGGWGLACAGAAELAFLLAPRRIDLIHGEKVAITPEAAGSTAEHLLRTLLQPYYGIELALTSPEDEGYDPAGPRLVAGREVARQAQEARAEGWTADDLSLSWWVLTGLPLVWEILCAPRGLEATKPGATAQLTALMKRSQRAASEQGGTIQELAANLFGKKPVDVKELFARQSYTLGAQEQKGLATFLDMAGRAKAF